MLHVVTMLRQFSVAVLARNIWRGGDGERGSLQPITEVWGQSPQQGQGAKPLWSWSTFGFL